MNTACFSGDYKAVNSLCIISIFMNICGIYSTLYMYSPRRLLPHFAVLQSGTETGILYIMTLHKRANNIDVCGWNLYIL